MTRHTVLVLAVVAAAVLVTPGDARAYEYDEGGFFLFLDAVMTTPGNTDQVVAEIVDWAGTEVQTSGLLQPEWDSSFSGRLGFGYRWASGGSLALTYWQYDDDAKVSAEGPQDGFMNFAIGPATYYDGYPVFNFGVPGVADFKTGIKANTTDVVYARDNELSEYFNLEWSIGLRYATFDENIEGTYDLCGTTACDPGLYDSFYPGEVTFDASKSNEARMFGFKAGLRGRFFASERIAITSGLAFSFLNGELESRSGLVPTGTFNGPLDPPSQMIVNDDARSGTITDFDVALEWYIVPDLFRLSFGYDYAVWEGLPEDQVRNPPGLLPVLNDREVVTFSGFKLGFWVRF